MQEDASLPRRIAGALTIILLGAVPMLAQAQPPAPPGTRGPSGDAGQGTGENGHLNNAVLLASQIANNQSGDNATAANAALEAWKQARKDGRFVVLTKPTYPKQKRGFTWPDKPDGTGPSNGDYLPGQTNAQYTGIQEEFLDEQDPCDCVVAVIILHEGTRLREDRTYKGPGATYTPEQVKKYVVSEQALWAADVQNIAMAMALCSDPVCETELQEMLSLAQQALKIANDGAGKIGLPAR